MNFKKILSSFSYVLGAQLLIVVLGVIRSLILPAFFEVESYGYWQIYVFYSAYVGLFALGFNDGIYLRYGDYNYDELPFEKLRSATRIHISMLIFFSLICVFFLYLFCDDKSLRFALMFSSFNILILGLSSVLTFVMQITNQIKRFSFFSVLDKILVLITILVMFFINNDNYKIIVIIDVFSKIIVLFFMMILLKEFFIGKTGGYIIALKEFRLNINIGLKLMIANLMGMLITGIGRITVQFFGDIEDFASYSFGTSITNIILLGITAFSLVLYPALKRLSTVNYKKYFVKINNVVTIFNMVSLLIYFPASYLIQLFFLKYIDVLEYLNLFFVITILLSKMNILNNTFYKVLRKEKEMLRANLSCVLVFCFCVILFFGLFRSVWSIAFSTMIAMLFRVFSSEIYLNNQLKNKLDRKLFYEVILLLVFIVVTSFFNLLIAFIIYLVLLCFYLYFFKNNLRKLI